MTGGLQPGRFAYGCGLALAVLLAIASVYIVLEESREIRQSIAAQKLLIQFDANLGLFAGVLPAALALAVICLPPLFGRTLSSRAHIAVSSLFVIAVFLGILSRIAVAAWMADYFEGRGYVYCAERSELRPRARTQGWVLDPSLCDAGFDIEDMTLPELRERLSGNPAGPARRRPDPGPGDHA
ncbi:MAG: hypothetical protein QNJ30_19595 [Kiloniellales bacterium]|nr:hypothetical protein [Kiloniellales bacterium]